MIRSSARRFVELFALCGFAVIQPLLAVFGAAPDAFIYRGADRNDMVAFLTIVVLGPPAVLWAVGQIVAMVRPAWADRFHAGLLALVGAVAVLMVAKDLLPWRGQVLLGLALAGGAAIGWASRRQRFREWLVLLGIVGVVAVTGFVFSSASGRLLRSSGSTTVAAAGEAPAVDRVVVVVLDELPLASLLDADEAIDAERFPHIARFAETSTWYRHATTVSTGTIDAVPALLSGNFPEDDQLPILTDHPDNLFTWLGPSHEIHASETWTRLCPGQFCGSAVGDGLSDVLRDARRVWTDLASPDDVERDPTSALIDRTQGWEIDDQEEGLGEAAVPTRLENLTDDVAPLIASLDEPAPALHYAHLLLPHVPYQFYASGRSYENVDEGMGKFLADWWVPGVWPSLLAQQRHLQQLAYTDGLLGRVFDELEARDQFDDAIVAVVADHGIAFGPELPSRARVGEEIPEDSWGQLVFVPMLVKGPGQRDGVIDDRPARTIDLLPTVADLAGTELPFDTDGRSLVAEPGPSDEGDGVDDGGAGTAEFFLYQGSLGNRARGPRVVRDQADGWAQVLGSRPDDPFDPDDGFAGFRTGPYGSLVGAEVSDLDAGDPSQQRAAIEYRPDLGADGGGLIIAHVRAGGPAELDDAVAVSVDGRIAGVAQLYKEFVPDAEPDTVDLRAIVLVPPALLGDDAATIELFTVSGAADAATLRPIPLDS